MIKRKARDSGDGEATEGDDSNHDVLLQAASAVRSAARIRAERARGFRAISSAVGIRARDQIRRKVCFVALRGSGVCREREAGLLRSARSRLRIRSYREEKATTTSRPPLRSTRSAASSPVSNSPNSSFTKMRSAWKVRVAGWMAKRA